MAWGAYLDMPRLLTTPAGILHGASYVDVEARLWMFRFLAIVSIVGALLAAYGASSLALWPIPAAVGLYALVFLGGSAYAVFLQRIIVTPNEQEAERPYIEYNIAATRSAFGLEQVEERELSGDASITRTDIANNAETINNVRLWDHEPLLQTFGQIQEIRTYYDFVSVDNDRYVIDGQYRQTMLSSRELNSESLPNPSWVNERLSFTHGYGVALGPVNQVTEEGLPMLFIKDLPPSSESPDLQVDEASIYFGELSNDYVIVNTDTEEFHYPEGDDNVFTTYRGDGGVAVSGIIRRLLFGLRFRTLNIIVSEQLQDGSKVLFHRNIRDRVTTIAPFLRYDADPYLVVSDGRLFWIQDAYTASESVSVLGSGNTRGQLHSELRQGRDRRLSRPHDVLPGRSRRSHRAHAGRHLSRSLAAARRDVRRSARACSLPGRDLRPADGRVLDLSHDEPSDLL